MSLGRAAAVDVAAHVRRERAAGAERRALAASRARTARCPRTASGSATASTRWCRPASTRCDGDDAGGAADRAGGVHAEHRLARRAERVGEVELGLHHALEQVGGLAERRRRRCRPVICGVVERAERGLADETAEGHVPAAASCGGSGRCRRSRTVGGSLSRPLPGCRPGSVAGTDPTSSGRARGAARRRGSWSAASATRTRPVAMIGLAASGPPDGFTATSAPRPSASTQQRLLVGERGLELGHLDRRRRRARRPSAAMRGRRRRRRGRASPGCGSSVQWAKPVIHTGSSHSSRALSPRAITTAHAPSVIGGRSWRRSGART